MKIINGILKFVDVTADPSPIGDKLYTIGGFLKFASLFITRWAAAIPLNSQVESDASGNLIAAPILKNYTVSEAVSTTTNTAAQNKLSVSYTPAVAGNYKIEWYYETTTSLLSGNLSRVTIDGTEVARNDANGSTANSYTGCCGFMVQNLTAAAHTVNIDFYSTSGLATTSIRRARVLITKMF